MTDEYLEWMKDFEDGKQPLTVQDMEAGNEKAEGDTGIKPSEDDVEWFKETWPDGCPSYDELVESFPGHVGDYTIWMEDMESP